MMMMKVMMKDEGSDGRCMGGDSRSKVDMKRKEEEEEKKWEGMRIYSCGTEALRSRNLATSEKTSYKVPPVASMMIT